MAFISVASDEIDQANPGKAYRMLGNGAYIPENEAQDIRLGHRADVSVAYSLVSKPHEPVSGKRAVLTEIKNPERLEKLAQLA